MLQNERPSGGKLKAVQLLECVPGLAGSTSGPPIVTMRFIQGHVLEESLMVSRYDAEHLVTLLLIALAHHGDEFAKTLLDVHFRPEARPWSQNEPADPESLPVGDKVLVVYPRRPLTYIVDQRTGPMGFDWVESAMPPSQKDSNSPSNLGTQSWRTRLTTQRAGKLRCTVRHGSHARPQHKMYVIAGYSDGIDTFVLGRRRGKGREVRDGIAKLSLPDHIATHPDEGGDWLPNEEWERLLKLPEGGKFLMNRKTWRRMRASDLAAVVDGKVFRLVR